MTSLNETANKILDIAEEYTQTQGFNAFSYRDIQNDLGIKTSSIHYYFPTKADLAQSMVERYLVRHQAFLDQVDQNNIDAIAKIKQLCKLFVRGVNETKFCLCGMLASDIQGLPTEVSKQVRQFFLINEQWIASVISQGIANKEINSSVNSERAAAQLLATLEGATLIARTRNSRTYLTSIIEFALEPLML